MTDPIEKAIAGVLAEMPEDEELSIPSRKAVIAMIKNIHTLFFPSFFPQEKKRSGAALLHTIADAMCEQIEAAFAFAHDARAGTGKEFAASLIAALPGIRRKLLLDAEAIYEGDPAARCKEAVIFSYPGFYAISIYRIAHEFYLREIPFIDRMMTEFAHEKTGIDIHAGAQIGEYFFIDHGTGIVIGETTTVGDHVKLYQGVTLGAKSFELDENGNPVKGIKRHPDIGDHVILYANATILGGSTKIGDGSIIGGNVWLTHSVEPGSVIYYSERHS